MSVLVTIGAASWRSGESPTASEVVFSGALVFGADGPLMIWDAGLNNIRAMTSGEIAALPSQKATAQAQAAKASATAGIDNGQLVAGDKLERIVRAVALAALDAFNADRQCLTDIKNATAAATSLANLQTRFAAITYPPQVTAAQLVTAIKTKIAATSE